jgi:hypothetical protein
MRECAEEKLVQTDAMLGTIAIVRVGQPPTTTHLLRFGPRGDVQFKGDINAVLEPLGALGKMKNSKRWV